MRKTNKVLVIISAILINLMVYISLLFLAVSTLKENLPREEYPVGNLLMGFCLCATAYAVYRKIKPFDLDKLITEYGDDLTK